MTNKFLTLFLLMSTPIWSIELSSSAVQNDTNTGKAILVKDGSISEDSVTIKIGRQTFDGTNSLLCTEIQINNEIQKHGIEIGAKYANMLWIQKADIDNECYRMTVDYFRDRNTRDTAYNKPKANNGEENEKIKNSIAWSVGYVIGSVIGLALVALIVK